ncbi:hypothetical protein BDV97DRAFT_359751 [Delphinella strobiligena]|nr:hypothetical protein BDV97DRAFT_359751 [Delphinella strobiligena]
MESPTPQALVSPSQQTQYSLDLDALNLDDSGSLSPIQSPKPDKIASDEIEGPTDFTINMGKWMKGGGTPQKRRGIGTWNFTSLDKALDEESIIGAQEAMIKDEVSPTAPSEIADSANGQSDPSARANSIDKASEAEDSNHDNNKHAHGTPNTELYPDADNSAKGNDTLHDLTLNGITEGSVTPRREEESSIWEPQYNSSSLRLTRPKNLLQPTVEDYNSELTPARPLSVVQQPTFSLTPEPPRRAASAHPFSPGRPSSPTLSPVRTPLATRTESGNPRRARSSARKGDAIPVRAQSSAGPDAATPARTPLLQTWSDKDPSAKDEELQRLRAELQDVRMTWTQTQSIVKTLRAQLDEERRNTSSLRSELEQSKKREHQLQLSADTTRREQQNEIDQLVDEMDNARSAEKDMLRLAENQRRNLEAAQRAVKEAHRLAEERAKELDQMHESEDAELQEIRWQLQQARQEEKSAKDGLDASKKQMGEQGRAHDEEVQRLGRDLAAARNDYNRAKDAEKSAQEHLRLLRQQMNEHATALRDETQRLRKELDEAQRHEENARSEADRYYSELEHLKTNQGAIPDITTQDATEETAHGADNDGAIRRAEELRLGLEKQLHDAQSQITTITRERKAEQEARDKYQRAQQKAEEEAKALKEELDMLQNLSKLDDDEEKSSSVLSKEFSELEAAYHKAVKLAETLRSDLETLKKQLQDQQTRHDHQIRDMHLQLAEQKEADAKQLAEEKSEHSRTIDLIEEGMMSVRNDRAALSAQVTALEQELEQARKDLEKKKDDDQTTALERDLKQVRNELEDMKDLNQAFDRRVTEMIKKREDAWRDKLNQANQNRRYWEEKAAKLESDREAMGKALLRQWGREECGITEDKKKNKAQKYAYKFPA